MYRRKSLCRDVLFRAHQSRRSRDRTGGGSKVHLASSKEEEEEGEGGEGGGEEGTAGEDGEDGEGGGGEEVGGIGALGRSSSLRTERRAWQLLVLTGAARRRREPMETPRQLAEVN